MRERKRERGVGGVLCERERNRKREGEGEGERGWGVPRILCQLLACTCVFVVACMCVVACM